MNIYNSWILFRFYTKFELGEPSLSSNSSSNDKALCKLRWLRQFAKISKFERFLNINIFIKKYLARQLEIFGIQSDNRYFSYNSKRYRIPIHESIFTEINHTEEKDAFALSAYQISVRSVE